MLAADKTSELQPAIQTEFTETVINLFISTSTKKLINEATFS